jgi:hypothetical protein
MRGFLIAGIILFNYVVSAQLTAIKCGKLIDGKNDQPLLNKAILVEGNQIKDIVEQTAIPHNAPVIELK